METQEEDNKLHLGLAITAVSNLTGTVRNMSDTLIVFKLSDYQILKDADNSFSSPSFYTSPSGYCMDIGMLLTHIFPSTLIV